jgi:myosin heavy subunit|eukprot:5775139-Prymnesium_polylepis.2
MDKLGKTQHHYIRCLKPNQTLQAGDWVTEFMFRQLAYSGTLEVTEIRKAGLNVRRPLQQFFRYYKLCADDQNVLRAGTVTKRCELLLTECKIDPNKWRVGKTLVFLKEYEILDELDKMREVKMVDWVILLQSYGRMFPPCRVSWPLTLVSHACRSRMSLMHVAHACRSRMTLLWLWPCPCQCLCP